ncbi:MULTISPECIES: outer membrane beta-barrel protein [unclassified Bradyrhizobium]|uniref:outer membrane protein n=1 Tax=unclassified Bradyrhizobium TaxID=2631580 RepID=UPI00247A6486|nr:MULTISPECIES: outer membrane beta-barrel protein [unclassified Bradyrhizobium]WGS20099.1 outer membrane beta-barrel protein [Bradyrhizobium sp. ISRA463]WGS26958.1 outer membrane beta-barrel protein [Bradyrhizobium sp. ISRA464]
MRSVKSLIAAGAACLLSSAAFAADMPIMPPPPMAYAPPPVQDFGGWYLRGDIGMTNVNGNLHVNSYDTLPPGSTLNKLGHQFSGGMSFGLGVGYQFNNWLRADITGEYRSKTTFSGTDFATIPGFGPISDVYGGGFTSWVGLVNLYADLGTWWCLTPFVGVGVGAAHIQTSGFQDSGNLFTTVTGPQNIVTGASFFADGASRTNFAWAVHAGVAYKVTNNFTVELAYRYLDMGTAVQGFGRSFDGSNAGPSSFQFRDLTSQDVRLGVRWTCCDVPPPPPPLVTKG